MTNEEKQLLLKDLCARLPYGVKCWASYNKFPTKLVDVNVDTNFFIVTVKLEKTGINKPSTIEDIKPYLRPMSSMTDEERKEYKSFIFTQHHEWDGHGTSTDYVETDDVERYFTWLNKKMFDYRGLIPMGLALEAPEDMYKEK